MDFLELLFADRVRTLAKELQADAREVAAEAAGQYWEDNVEKWEYENPWAAFIEAAHAELAAIANHVRQL